MSGRSLLLAALAALPAAAPAGAAEGGAQALLERTRLEAAVPDAAWLEERLLDDSAGSFEAIALALDGHAPSCAESARCLHLERKLGEALRQALRELALTAAARAEACSQNDPRRGRLAGRALELLALGGWAQDVELAVRLATPSPGAPCEAGLAARLQLAAGSILARDTRAYAALRRTLEAAPVALLARLLGAVGAQDCVQAARLLPAFLDRDAKLDMAALSQLARLAPRYGHALDEIDRAGLRARLGAPDPALRREAARVLGRIEDEGAVGALIERLADTDRGARDSALWALRCITGLSMDAGDPRWQRWYEKELGWWEESAGRHLRALRSPRAEDVIAAVRQLSEHRLHASELALELEPLAIDPRPAIAGLACASLGGLRRRSSLPALVEALAHADPQVRSAAHLALRQISGLDLAPRVDDWRQELAGEAGSAPAQGLR